jgi:phospholipase C
MRAALWASLLLIGCGPGHRAPGACDGPCPQSAIRHVVIIVQENHTFDNYFGRYCTAAAGSNPTCTDGPACCEAGPDHEPGGAPPTALTDAEHAAYSPDHSEACEREELDGGALDKFVTSATCGSPRNFAYADGTLLAPYWDLARGGALADRYFQPTVGASSANDMYLARARFVFKDNDVKPDAIGQECSFVPTVKEFSDQTLGDLLIAKQVSFSWYIEGYQAVIDARKTGSCPDPPDGCALALPITPCVYEVSDIPFQYYKNMVDNPLYMRDFSRFKTDLSNNKLPQVSFLKAVGYHSEHPGLKTKISDGVAFVTAAIAAVAQSDYAPDTLILFTYDEGGGYFDHVKPPPTSAVDGQPYFTRVPFVASGPAARKNAISHVPLEHSSLVKFLEWNWQAGSLGARDAEVANLGSLLDPALNVPEN